jgi:hypothetical protein
MTLNLFCYGSNSIKQLQQRLHINEKISWKKAYINNYVRIFAGYSKRWNGGIASIFPCDGKKVYGILVKLKVEDFELLNSYECGYHLKILDVCINSTNIVQSFVYIKTNNIFKKMPSDSYMNAINSMLNDRSQEGNNKSRKIFIRCVLDNKIKLLQIWTHQKELK